MDPHPLIAEYLAGPAQLRQAVQGMSREQLLAQPVPGKWSTLQVICHIADFEPVYIDRMKRVIAQDKPTFFGGDPDLFAARLAYEQRDAEAELHFIDACRQHMGVVLRALQPADFARVGIHSEAGEMTLEKLLGNITRHVGHHLPFIAEKRAALGV